MPEAPICDAEAAVVIVSFRNPGDVLGCLNALAKAPAQPSFSVLICENGGTEAYDTLVAALSGMGLPAVETVVGEEATPFDCLDLFRLGALRVTLGKAPANLGYAGGINAWLTRLAGETAWRGVWVLNPDTTPEPDALAALVRFADDHGKGMVGSRAMFSDTAKVVRARGLKWRKLAASVQGVDIFAPADVRPDPADIEARIDAPSGCSFYVTRACFERIGMMDDRYFLLFEDLEWGLRAKACCGVGYAYDSVVPHIGGTSIGSGKRMADRSRLAVYLEFRNRILFVRWNYSGWLAWTVFMAVLQSARLLFAGAPGNFAAAWDGLRAGLAGETGRPDRLMPAP
ncbi:MAG TPA: glycosyltransferase family 2 protein [Caulobacteraceae bacterium]